MRAILGACALCCGIFSMPEADASVLINIDLSSQTMHVNSDMGSYDWRISTARSGYRTPRGTYRPYQLQRTHYSHKYHYVADALFHLFRRRLCDPWHL
jgi:hypothetical protein